MPSGGYSSPCIFRTSVSISRIVKKESAEDTYNLTKNMFSVTGQRKKSILRADIWLSLHHIFAVCTFSSVSICPFLYFNIKRLYVSFSQLKSSVCSSCQQTGQILGDYSQVFVYNLNEWALWFHYLFSWNVKNMHLILMLYFYKTIWIANLLL